ncbi:MAG: hypothetical protein WAW86_08240 [Gammaproteobacteria bacterium]
MITRRHESCACETRSKKQIHFHTNCTINFQLSQLISLARWLFDECHSPEASSKIIIREFFKKTNEMGGGDYEH